MKKKLLLGLILFTGVLSAQTEFRSGYIIKKNKDTVYGEIDYRSDYIMSKVCKFKKDEKTIEYRPNDLKSYRFTNGKFFVSQKIEGKTVFLQFLVKGKLNAYYLFDNNQSRYFLENAEGGLREIPYKEKRVEIDGVNYLKKSTIQYGLLSRFTIEAPELQSEINKMDGLNHSNIISLAKNYHNAVCETEQCIVYEEKTRKINYNIELIGGVIKFQDHGVTDNLSDLSVFQTGVLLHTSIPFLGDKWYFKTGVVYAALEFATKTRGYYRIPLHIEYIHYKGFVRPRFSYGYDLSNMLTSTSLDVGLQIKATERFFLSVGTELFFTTKAFFLPEDFYALGLNAGLCYKF